jgi:hypothetical protein
MVRNRPDFQIVESAVFDVRGRPVADFGGWSRQPTVSAAPLHFKAAHFFQMPVAKSAHSRQ